MIKRIPIFQLLKSKLNLFENNLEFDIQINSNINISNLTFTDQISNFNLVNSGNSKIVPNLNGKNFEHKCNSCNLTFNDKEIRNQHYRSDLHVYNLKLKLEHLPIVSPDEYNKIINGSQDEEIIDEDEGDDDDTNSSSVDSISSLEIKSLDINNDTAGDIKMKILSKDLNTQFTLYKCLLGSSDLFKLLSQYQNDSQYQMNHGVSMLNQFKHLVSNSGSVKWSILLLSGGRFAGSVNQSDKCILHKTFHRYTTRKKQGGSQSSKDSQGQTKHSAGAAMRRYNEKRLKEQIEEILKSWKSELDQCSYIFIFAPKGNTRDTLFPPTPSNNWIQPNDDRIRNIPFPVLRPTFAETQRISNLLFNIDIDSIHNSINNQEETIVNI